MKNRGRNYLSVNNSRHYKDWLSSLVSVYHSSVKLWEAGEVEAPWSFSSDSRWMKSDIISCNNIYKISFVNYRKLCRNMFETFCCWVSRDCMAFTSFSSSTLRYSEAEKIFKCKYAESFNYPFFTPFNGLMCLCCFMSKQCWSSTVFSLYLELWTLKKKNSLEQKTLFNIQHFPCSWQ